MASSANKKPIQHQTRITEVWYPKISESQMMAIIAVTQGIYRFGSERLGYEQGDEERLKIMLQAGQQGSLRIEHQKQGVGKTKQDLHQANHRYVHFYFDGDDRDSTGTSLYNQYCISFWDEANANFNAENRKRLNMSEILKNTPTYGAKTIWEWVQKFLKLE